MEDFLEPVEKQRLDIACHYLGLTIPEILQLKAWKEKELLDEIVEEHLNLKKEVLLLKKRCHWLQRENTKLFNKVIQQEERTKNG